jgi:serine protease
MRMVFTAAAQAGFIGSLMAASLVASAAGPKLGGQATASTSVSAAGGAAPAARLIIRYSTGVKLAGQGGVTQATERHEAAMRVARTAHLSGLPRLEYLKSVSPSLHVVALPASLSPSELQAMVERLREDPGVADVAIDHRMKPHLVPNDPRFVDGAQWHLMNSLNVPGGINASTAWDFSSGSGVVVAVLDGGYRPHADLASNVLLGYDFISPDSGDPTASNYYGGDLYWTANDRDGRDTEALDPGDWISDSDAAAGYCASPEPSSWHGTHVAGIVAAVGNNASDGLGVAFGARILPVRVLGRCGGYTSDILAGARWAAGLPLPGVPTNATPAKILNLSLGVAGQACTSVAQSVVDEIRSRNVSIVASSGNEGSTSSISLPANCRGVVAVTAHTREGDNADYANVGPGVAISAPGGGSNSLLPTPATGIRGVLSTWNNGPTVPGSDALGLLSGTSMAAPQVAGVLALLASLRPELSMADLEGIVTRSVRPFPAGSFCALPQLPAGFCGSGLLDAQLALAAATVYVAPPPAVTPPPAAPSTGGGGGCTAAPDGQADAGLPLLALLAGLVLFWRRRRPAA